MYLPGAVQYQEGQSRKHDSSETVSLKRRASQSSVSNVLTMHAHEDVDEEAPLRRRCLEHILEIQRENRIKRSEIQKEDR